MVEEAEDGCRGSGQKNESESEPTKQRISRAEKGEVGGKVDLQKKVRTKTWSYVVKGLEEDESETVDSVEKSDSDEPYHMKAKRSRRRPYHRAYYFEFEFLVCSLSLSHAHCVFPFSVFT